MGNQEKAMVKEEREREREEMEGADGLSMSKKASCSGGVKNGTGGLSGLYPLWLTTLTCKHTTRIPLQSPRA